MRASATGGPRGKWRRYAPWIAALVAVVLLAGAAGAYLATRPTGLASAAVPKARLAGPVKIIGGQNLGLYARRVVGVQPPTGLLQSLGPVWHVGPDGRLAHAVTIEFPLDHVVPASQQQLVLVMARESPASGRWVPLPTQVVDGGRYAEVTVHRLSWFTPIWEQVQQAEAVIKQVFDSLTGGAYTAPDPPQCSDTQAAGQDGYKFWDQAGAPGDPPVLWCYGENAAGTRVVKVVSTRHYALLLTHKAMDVMSLPAEDILQLIGQALDTSGVVLYPRHELSFNADEAPGAMGKVVSDVGQQAQLMSSLDVGLQALVAIVTRFGWGKAPNQELDLLDKFLTIDECRTSAPDPAAMVANCFSAKELTQAFGTVVGLLLVPVMTWSGVWSYFEGFFQGVFDQWTHRAQFGIGVRNTTPGKVYLRTAPTQGFQAGFRQYKPPCAAAEDCPLVLFPNSGSGASSFIALLGTQWTSWTFAEATGTGTLIVGLGDNPTTQIVVPVRVTLSQPVQACGYYYWSTAEFTTLSGNPPSVGQHDLFNAALAIRNINDKPCPT